MLLGMIRTKAAEAGSWLSVADPRQLKPTQRCHRCGDIVKKSLSERRHICHCDGLFANELVCDRDENAAKTMLRWMLEGEFWLKTVKKAGDPPETPCLTA